MSAKRSAGSPPSEKPNAALRNDLRRAYLRRCLALAFPVGVAGAALVFVLYWFVRGLPRTPVPVIGCVSFLFVFAAMYAVWAYRRRHRVALRFKGLVTPRSVQLDGFARLVTTVAEGTTRHRTAGWLFVTDAALYLIPMAKNDDTYFSVRLADIRLLQADCKHPRRILLAGGTLNGYLAVAQRDEVAAVLTALLPTKENGVTR